MEEYVSGQGLEECVGAKDNRQLLGPRVLSRVVAESAEASRGRVTETREGWGTATCVSRAVISDLS